MNAVNAADFAGESPPRTQVILEVVVRIVVLEEREYLVDGGGWRNGSGGELRDRGNRGLATCGPGFFDAVNPGRQPGDAFGFRSGRDLPPVRLRF